MKLDYSCNFSDYVHCYIKLHIQKLDQVSLDEYEFHICDRAYYFHSKSYSCVMCPVFNEYRIKYVRFKL